MPEAMTRWSAYLRRSGAGERTLEFVNVIGAIERFLMPVIEAARDGSAFEFNWKNGGPWLE